MKTERQRRLSAIEDEVSIRLLEYAKLLTEEADQEHVRGSIDGLELSDLAAWVLKARRNIYNRRVS